MKDLLLLLFNETWVHANKQKLISLLDCLIYFVGGGLVIIHQNQSTKSLVTLNLLIRENNNGVVR